MNFYVAAVGCKGDWPWVRKAFHLATGYRSNRICHLCPSEVSCHKKNHQFSYIFTKHELIFLERVDIPHETGKD